MKLAKSSLALICCLSIAGSATAARAAKSTAVLVPVRYVAVQLAFDLAALDKGVSLVSYESTGDPDAPALHVWDPRVNGWLAITMSEFRSGAVFGDTPDRVLLVGKDVDQMAVLADAAEAWPAAVKRIESLAVDTIVNAADAYFNFTPYEWKWLAKRYQLKLEDLNAERRRYGRFGKPGEPARQLAPGAEVETSEPRPLPMDEAEPVLQPEAAVEPRTLPMDAAEPVAEPEAAAEAQSAAAASETAPDAPDVDPADK